MLLLPVLLQNLNLLPFLLVLSWSLKIQLFLHQNLQGLLVFVTLQAQNLPSALLFQLRHSTSPHPSQRAPFPGTPRSGAPWH